MVVIADKKINTKMVISRFGEFSSIPEKAQRAEVGIGRSATPRRCRPIGPDGMQATESKVIIPHHPQKSSL